MLNMGIGNISIGQYQPGRGQLLCRTEGHHHVEPQKCQG